MEEKEIKKTFPFKITSKGKERRGKKLAKYKIISKRIKCLRINKSGEAPIQRKLQSVVIRNGRMEMAKDEKKIDRYFLLMD